MKKLATITLIAGAMLTNVCLATSTPNTSIEGSWQGKLVITPEKSMALVFHFNKTKNGYKASVDVPSQQQFGLEFNKVSIADGQISLALDMAKIKYSATIEGEKITGTYSQGGFKAPLNLVPAKTVTARQKKPQEASDRVDYLVENVDFINKDGNHKLSGTLTYPAGPIESVAILLSGSGPTNRDADVFGHKVFAVLADQLTRQNIAVLRYDDRGVGESTGDFPSATSEDFASDANAAYSFIASNPKFKNSNIGFVGHSEGGLIGAIASAKNSNIDFFVSLAGPGTTGAQILIDQSFHIQKLREVPESELLKSDKAQRQIMGAIEQGASQSELISLLIKHGATEQQAKAQAKQMTSPWFDYFVKTDPKKYLSKLHMPVLALNGELDVQVLANQNIAGIKQAVSPSNLTTKVYKGLNHLFQPATTGLPKEYSKIDITFSEHVSIDISQWIKSQQ